MLLSLPATGERKPSLLLAVNLHTSYIAMRLIMVLGLFHGLFSDVLFVHSTRQKSYIRMQHGQSQSTNPKHLTGQTG